MEPKSTSVGLAHYAAPPIVETVLGVQFDKLPALKNSCFGAFWTMLDRAEWPTLEDAPQLPMRYERFTEAARWAQEIQFEFSPIGGCRAQFKNRNNDRMIQFQNGRFLFNWLGEGGKEYPRFDSVYEGFSIYLSKFREFLESFGLGAFRPNQWDLTYVNNIPKGQIWKSPDDWHFFKLLGKSPGDAFLRSETFNGEWKFEIPGEKGRLYASWQHAKHLNSSSENSEFVRLELTARGGLPTTAANTFESQIEEGLKTGRAAIVQSFKLFMSDDANSHWGLE